MGEAAAPRLRRESAGWRRSRWVYSALITSSHPRLDDPEPVCPQGCERPKCPRVLALGRPQLPEPGHHVRCPHVSLRLSARKEPGYTSWKAYIWRWS